MNSEIQSKIRMGEKVKDIIIIGAGGFGREVQWLIERINEKEKEKTGEAAWNILGYVDDGMEAGTMVNDYPVLGGTDDLLKSEKGTAVVCAIGAAAVREKLVKKIRKNPVFTFPNLVDPSVQMSKRIDLGEGNLICAGNILTVNISIADFCIINLDCTFGHDIKMDSFVTVYPGVHISGCVCVGTCSELGTGSQIIQGKQIGKHVIVGAGSVVVKDIPDDCTAVGNPCNPIKFRNIPGGIKKPDAIRTGADGSAGTNRTLFILGAGGHGKVIQDIASFSYKEICFLDDNPDRIGKSILCNGKEIKVVGDKTYAVNHKEADVFIAIGDSKIREKMISYFEEHGVPIVSLIHPDATISYDVKIEEGTVIMAGTVINSGTRIGKGVIINTGATVDHDNEIGDFTHVAVGAHLAGTVTTGCHVWIGAGAVISNNLYVCDNCTIGAGAVVVKSIEKKGIFLGVPAREKTSR